MSLADGVAHNFNNLLQAIVSAIQLALLRLTSGKLEGIKSILEELLEKSRSGIETVRYLSDFARLEAKSVESELTTFDLSESIKKIFREDGLLQKVSTDAASVKVCLELTEGCMVLGNEKEITEAILNLVINAYEAQLHGGEITIKTFVKNNFIYLQVKDEGVGIPKTDINKIFLPFWTSKGFQRMGMGLARTYAIVSRHNGYITVESNEGEVR